MKKSTALQLSALAARHHGVFTRAEALAMGLSSSAVTRRVESGLWLRPAPGIYVVAGSPATWRRAVAIAVVGAGSGAIASHLTSAHLWGLAKRPKVIEVTTPHAWRRTRNYVIHRSTDLIAGDVVELDGIETSTVARMLVDIGVPWGEAMAARCLDEAERKKMTSARQVAQVLHRVARKGRNGVGPMREVLKVRLGWASITDSQLEDEFGRIMAIAGVELPEPQVRMIKRGGRFITRVDYAYRELDLVIALDGEQYHSDHMTFRRDRRQQNELVLENQRVLRFTAWDVFAAPEYVVATVVEALRTFGNPSPRPN